MHARSKKGTEQDRRRTKLKQGKDNYKKIQHVRKKQARTALSKEKILAKTDHILQETLKSQLAEAQCFLFWGLPTEVSLLILSHFQFHDFCTLIRVCQLWRLQILSKGVIPVPDPLYLSNRLKHLKWHTSNHARNSNSKFRLDGTGYVPFIGGDYIWKAWMIEQTFSPSPFTSYFPEGAHFRRFILIRPIVDNKRGWPCLYFKYKSSYPSQVADGNVVLEFISYCEKKDLWEKYRCSLVNKPLTGTYIQIDWS